MNFNYSEFQDILNELYVGETPFIKSFIELVSSARAPYVGKIKRPIKGNRDFVRIGDMLAEEFGFRSVTFTVPFDTSMNAFTYPITMSTDKSVRGIKPRFFQDSGLKYDDNTSRMSTLIAVTAGTWFSKEISDREVVALILHEVGHSFVLQSRDMVDIIEANRAALLVNMIYKIIMDIYTNPFNLPNDIKDITFSSDAGKQLINEVTRKLASHPLFAPFNGISAVSEWVTGMMTNLVKEVAFMINGPLNIAMIPLNMLVKFVTAKDTVAYGRSQEYMSDSFASMYGLGPELSSALTKIEYSTSASGSIVDKVASSLPVIGALHAAMAVPALLLLNGLTTHPSTVARMNKIIAELEYELKNSELHPKTKQELKKNIEELKQIKEEFISLQKDKKYDAEMVKRFLMNSIANDPDDPTGVEKTYTDLANRNKYVKESNEFNIELI